MYARRLTEFSPHLLKTLPPSSHNLTAAPLTRRDRRFAGIEVSNAP